MKQRKSTIQHLIFLLCICPLVFSSQSGRAQTSVLQVNPPIAPPETRVLVKYCIGVKCKGNGYWEIIPGYGETPEEAEADAKTNAEAHCGGAQNVENTRHTRVEVILCPFVDWEENPLFALRANIQDGVWRVKGRLHYCDGTEGFGFVTSGPTRCAAIKQAQTQLCLAKDPCKRACVTVWVIETPSCAIQPVRCYPSR